MIALLPLLALALPALADSSNSTASTVDIEGLEANFQQAEIVPDLIETFNPAGLLTVEFSGSAITTGQNLTEDAVASSPTLSITPASNATFDSDTLYTVIMVDANTAGTDESTTEQTRHWLVNSVSLSTDASTPYAVNYTGCTTITDYAGPGPDSGSGPHRYVVIMYEQPSTFAAPSNLSTAGTALGTMYLSSYVSESGLGDVVSANYFQVEVGTATVTPESTSSVESSTLAGYGSTTVSSDSTGTYTNSDSATGSSTASSTDSSSTASSTSGAGINNVAWGVVAGGVGLVSAVLGAGMV